MKSWVVTGGVASGKSRFCEHVQSVLGDRVLCFSADQCVARLLESGLVLSELASLFGTTFVTDAGTLDKQKLRALAFDDPDARKKLEHFIHPLVFESLEDQRQAARKKGVHLFLAEVPLLFESNIALDCDLAILVAASPSIQIERVAASRGLTRETATKIIQAQLPLEKKIALAGVVVWNEGEPSLLKRQVNILLQQLEIPNMCIESIEEKTQDAALPETTTRSETQTATTPAEENPAGAVSQDKAQVAVEAPAPQVPQPPFPVEASINELQTRTLGALQLLAQELGWRVNGSRSKHQLVAELVAWMGEHGTRIVTEGFLEIPEGSFGLLRYPKYNFSPLPEDIFVPVYVLKKFNLRQGQRIKVTLKMPREREKYMGMDRLLEIEGRSADDWQQPADFEKLTATFPSERIILETSKDSSVSARVVDLVAPLGKGQRALIVASPRSGKTMLLKEVARSIKKNHGEVHLIILLLDERPEEVTDFEESVDTEIYSSTFDEASKRHAQVAELVLERAKRLVEMRQDVVLLLDSITRLARGYNAMQSGKGAIMSGGLGTKALMKPKKFFGSARKVAEGGSLTIVATALVETESRMDDVIFEEFKGTGNMEINLDREIAERRVYPAIHLQKSGTRRDELLYHPDEFRRIGAVRKQLAAVPAAEGLETLIKNIQRTGSNAELLLKGLK